MKRTLDQNKRLHTIITALRIDAETKAAMVHAYTNGRTESTAEMTKQECDKMIQDLNEEHLRQIKQKQSTENIHKQTLRRDIFKLCYDLQWINAEMTSAEKLTVINNWLSTRTSHKKDDLNKLSIDELKSAINQLKAVQRNYIEKKNIVANGYFQTMPRYGVLCLN